MVDVFGRIIYTDYRSWYSECVHLFDADPGGRAVEVTGLRGLTCWDCGFEFRRRHGSYSLVNAVRCTDTSLCVGPIPRPEESYRVCTRHSVWSGATIALYTHNERAERGQSNKNMYLMTHRPTYLIFWKSFTILISCLQYEGLHSSHSYQLHYSWQYVKKLSNFESSFHKPKLSTATTLWIQKNAYALSLLFNMILVTL